MGWFEDDEKKPLEDSGQSGDRRPDPALPPPVLPEAVPPVKRGRGRFVGSKNKPPEIVAGGRTGVIGFDLTAVAKARKILRRLGRQWVSDERTDANIAYRNFTRGLMDNLAVLVYGGAISLKDSSELALKITTARGGIPKEGREDGMTPLEATQKWLNEDGAEVS